jgi:hypothetical protein
MVEDEGRESPVTLLERPIRRVAEALRSHSRRSQRVSEVHSLLALNQVRELCLAPEGPQHTHPWRDTVKREVREEQEKGKVVGPYLPSSLV